MKYVSHERAATRDDLIITVAVRQRWWRKTTVLHRYIGGGTVWHHFPSFRRASTSTEIRLTEIADWIRYQAAEVAARSDKGQPQ